MVSPADPAGGGSDQVASPAGDHPACHVAASRHMMQAARAACRIRAAPRSRHRTTAARRAGGFDFVAPWLLHGSEHSIRPAPGLRSWWRAALLPARHPGRSDRGCRYRPRGPI